MAGSKSKINKSAIVEGARSIKYTAQELTVDRMPFTTNTVTNTLNMAKDLREWTRRNNPFKAVNGNKDPLVRQIANASMKGLKAAKQDLLHGDLRFSRLNKEFRAFVGGEDPEHMFDFMDMDFGDFDYGGSDGEEGNEDRTMVAMGQSISREFTDTQMAATSATISAVETATDRISTISLRASEVATNRIISANLANMSRLSTQIGQVSGELVTVNQNLSLLVQQGNDINQFLGQSQKFMENTEQSLNDIKALLGVIAAPHQQSQSSRRADNTPEWLENGFDPKAFLKDKMSNTSFGMMASYVVGTAFNALHLEIPSIIDQTMVQELGDLKPLNKVLSKLLPAIDRFGHVDEMIDNAFKTLLAKMDNMEFNDDSIIGNILNQMGFDGWGYKANGGHKSFNLAGYNKGSITWNGKSERALQEVIPSYLSNIEGYLKNIAEGLEMDRKQRYGTSYGIDTTKFRLYDYENGDFTNLENIRKGAQKVYNDAAQSAFYDIMQKIEKNVNTGDGINRELSKVFTDLIQDESEISNPRIAAEFKRVLKKYRLDGKLNDAEIMSLFNELTLKVKPDVAANLNKLRMSTNSRDNNLYHLGEKELWKLKASVKFDTQESFEKQARDDFIREHANDPDAIRDYDIRIEKAKREKERKENSWLKRKIKSTDAGKYLFDVWEDLQKHGGPINRTIEYAQDYGIINPLLSLVHGVKGYAKGTGIKGLKGNQVVAAHDGEIIFTKEQSDLIRDIQTFNRAQRIAGEKTRMNLHGDVREMTGTIKNHRVNVKRRAPANDVERKFSSVVHNANVEKAQTREDEVYERYCEFTDNIASIAAVTQNSVETEKQENSKASQDKMHSFIFGEKDENGFYHGKMFSDLGNMVLDFKNMVNHAFTGEAYTTSAGNKVAKTDDCLKGNIGKSLATAGDAAARTIFGENYKDSKFYKGAHGYFSDFSAALKATYNGEEVTDEFWAKRRLDRQIQPELSSYIKLSPEQRKRYEQYVLSKKQGLNNTRDYLEEAYNEDAAIDSDDPEFIAQLDKRAAQLENINNEIARLSRKLEWIDKFNETNTSGEESDAVKQANLALFGVENIEDINKSISEATQETAKAGSTAHDKFIRGIKFGLGGAIGVTAAKYLGLGAIPSFFLPGGPIGGAILGVGVSILSKNKTFMAHLFGGEDNEGNKVDGIISKDLQDKFKTAGKKILGPATIGAIGGLVFPKAVGAISSHLGLLGGLVGTGPIGGAVLASGAALLLGSTQLKEKLFGKDENGKATGIISKSIAKGKEFLSNNKDALKRAGLGTLGGALLGTKLFGLTGLALGPTILGTAIGMSTMSSKFTDYLFGTKIMTKDKDGNTVWTRDGDGLFGRISRMVSVNVLAPIKSFVANGADRLVEYIKHDIGFSIRSIFSPFTIPIKDAVDNLSKAFKKIGDKATKLAKKFFDPLLKVGGGLLKGLTKFNLGVAKFGMHIAGNIIASPLKLLGGIGNRITKKKSSKIKKANSDFRRGYFDENGKYQAGIIGKFINPLAWGERIVKKTTKAKGIGNKISGFFEAINPFEAYGEERQNFAKKRGLENDTAFTGGLFGAEWKRHKDAEKLLDKQEVLDKTQVSLAQEWAKHDRYNNKIQLSKLELKTRNKKLRDAYTAADLEYTDMNNDQMMKFIYDPLGKRGENKEKVLEREEARHAEMKSIVETISGFAEEIADVLTGRKDKMTKKQRKAYEEEQKKKEEEAKTTDGAFKILAGAEDEEEDNLSWWERYVNWAFDGTIGRAHRGIQRRKRLSSIKKKHSKIRAEIRAEKRRDRRDKRIAESQAKNANIAAVLESSEEGMSKLKRMIWQNTPYFSDLFHTGNTGTSKLSREERREAKAEKKAKLNRTYDVYKATYKNNKKRISQLLKEVNSGKEPKISEEEAESLGLNTTKNLADEIRMKAKSMKLLSKRGFAKVGGMEEGGMKVALKATKGSLMEMLVSKKSVIVGLGTAAIGIGITALVTKFPKIIDWFKDTAIPFMTKTLWPFLRDTVTGLLKGIGAAVMGAIGIVKGGQNAVTKFLNFCSSGTWEDPEVTEQKSSTAHSYGMLSDDEMKYYVDSKAGVAQINNKDARSELEMGDYLAAAFAYMGNMYKNDNKSAVEISIPKLKEYVKLHPHKTNARLNSILNKNDYELGEGHTDFRNLPSSTQDYAAEVAVRYLNNEFDTYVEKATSAMDATENNTSGEESVGYGHFIQNDPRWRNLRYAKNGSSYTTIGSGGCGPTALANVASQLGVRTNPAAIASMASRSGYTAQGGTNARLFSEGASRLGLNSRAIGKGNIRQALESGRKVVFAGRGKGLYTSVGHILSARGIDSRGNAIVDDPLRSKSIRVPMSRIGSGLTNAWSIGRGIADYEADKATKNNNSEEPQETNTSTNNDYLKHTKDLMRADSLGVSTDGSYPAAYYPQVDDKWGDKDLKYTSGDMRTDGCYVSALGSLLANITGLNYRPDFYVEESARYAGGQGHVNMLGANLPPSLQGKNAYRIRFAGASDGGQFSFSDAVQLPTYDWSTVMDDTGKETDRIFISGRYMDDNGNILSSTGGTTRKVDEVLFRNILTTPFVLVGGSNWSKKRFSGKDRDKDVFRMCSDPSQTYTEHAVLVIPSINNTKEINGEFTTPMYYILNPGTGKFEIDGNGFRRGINTGDKISFYDLFNEKQGLQSMFIIDKAVDSVDQMKSYTNTVDLKDAEWFNKKHDQTEALKGDVPEYNGYDVVTGNNPLTSSGDSGDESDGSSESSGNFLTKLTAALGKLGNIAMNILGSIFGGEYKSVYDGTSSSSSSGSSGSNGGGGINYSAPTMADLVDEYIENNAWAKKIQQSGNPTAITEMRKAIESKLKMSMSDTATVVKNIKSTGADYSVLPYTVLPDYAKKSAGITTWGLSDTLPTSIRLSQSEVSEVEEGISRLVWNHETNGDYANVIENDNGGISAGIGGFHNGNLIEILHRMQNSGELEGDQKSKLDNLLSNGFNKIGDVYYLRDGYYDDLVELLKTDVSRKCQDAFLHQMHMSSLEKLISAYDSGLFNDTRSLMAIGQFQGFGPAFVSGMLGKNSDYAVSGFPSAFKDLKYNSSEELANTVEGMNKYYSTRSTTYVSGHQNRFKDVYKELGGTQSLGFGGGIRDSYNTTGYYDSVDTPVAINSVPKVEIVDEPITSRLDIIIDCLRRIVAQANTSGATTAKDNLDIGRGLANDMKMKYAGLDRKETLPVYKKDTTNIDRMRDIHNKIARSPRSM